MIKLIFITICILCTVESFDITTGKGTIGPGGYVEKC